jgi:hypothetical protein
MSVQMVLLPVFVQVGLTFVLLLWMAGARRQTLVSGETKIKNIALGQPNWPARATQIGNCYRNQFEIPVLFYVLIALALPIRHADYVIVLLSWVFVVTRLVHAVFSSAPTISASARWPGSPACWCCSRCGSTSRCRLCCCSKPLCLLSNESLE